MQREQLARGSGGSSRDDDEGVVVMLRRSSAAARVTCGLCRGLVRDATTVPECLHSFCRSCIYEKFADEEDSCCPTCNIDLGCSPLDKIRFFGLNRRDIFDDERLEKVWWDRVQEIDELKNPTRVVSSFARTTMNKALEQIVTVVEYNRQLVQLRQEKAELCEQAERWFKSDEKTLLNSFDYKKAETKKLSEKIEDLMSKLQEANSANQRLQGRLNEKDKEVQTWEQRYIKDAASHAEEVKKLDSRLVEQVVEIKRLREASTRNQEEMKSLKINLQDNVSLLNNVLGGLYTEGITPREDTISAHSSAIGDQVRTLQELVTTMKTSQFDSIKEAVKERIKFVLAKLKAHDPSINLQPVIDNFPCLEAKAEQLMTEMQSIAEEVTEDMQIKSPSSE